MFKVRLGHLDFTIKEMDHLSSKEAYGLYVAETQEIHLCRGMSKQRHGEVLLHEILHGIVDFANIAHLLKDNEEPIVRGIAIGLATTMRDNPKVFTDIIAALK